jgi:protocatechuate 3,4-dioxygenase beta subunit
MCPLFASNSLLAGGWRAGDSSTAVAPQANVEVEAIDSGVVTRVVTNDQGYYNFPSLLSGFYNIAVGKGGFRTVRRTQLQLIVQQRGFG